MRFGPSSLSLNVPSTLLVSTTHRSASEFAIIAPSGSTVVLVELEWDMGKLIFTGSRLMLMSLADCSRKGYQSWDNTWWAWYSRQSYQYKCGYFQTELVVDQIFSTHEKPRTFYMYIMVLLHGLVVCWKVIVRAPIKSGWVKPPLGLFYHHSNEAPRCKPSVPAPGYVHVLCTHAQWISPV